jgi:ribosomal-protein-alanine N-acetyltransferase
MNDDSAAIVPATVLHAPLMAEIHSQAFPAAEHWNAAALQQHMSLPGGFGLVHPAGFVLARALAGEAEVLTLAVLPAARRRGLGRALLLGAMGAAAALGAADLYLEVAETNEAALALYRGAGGQMVGRRRAYYPDGGDACVYRITLTSCE